MAISSENDRRSVTLPKKLWSDLEADAERVKSSGQKVTVSELIQRAVEESWAQGEPEEQAWIRRMDQLSHDVEQLRAEMAKEFQDLHVRLTTWLEEIKRGWPSGSLLTGTPHGALHEQYRHVAGGKTPDPFAPSPSDATAKSWWKR